MSQSTELPISGVIELVTAGIDRVRRADEARRHFEMEPGSRTIDRLQACEHLEHSEREFGWQWKNVQRIIDHLKDSANKMVCSYCGLSQSKESDWLGHVLDCPKRPERSLWALIGLMLEAADKHLQCDPPNVHAFLSAISGPKFPKQARELVERVATLETVIRDLLAANPAFRSKPIGAPHGQARTHQEEAITAEDRARVVLKVEAIRE